MLAFDGLNVNAVPWQGPRRGEPQGPESHVSPTGRSQDWPTGSSLVAASGASSPAAPRVGAAGPEAKTLCKFHVSGGCTRGDKCPYSHDLTVQAAHETDASRGFVLEQNVANAAKAVTASPAAEFTAGSPASHRPSDGFQYGSSAATGASPQPWPSQGSQRPQPSASVVVFDGEWSGTPASAGQPPDLLFPGVGGESSQHGPVNPPEAASSGANLLFPPAEPKASSDGDLLFPGASSLSNGAPQVFPSTRPHAPQPYGRPASNGPALGTTLFSGDTVHPAAQGEQTTLFGGAASGQTNKAVSAASSLTTTPAQAAKVPPVIPSATALLPLQELLQQTRRLTPPNSTGNSLLDAIQPPTPPSPASEPPKDPPAEPELEHSDGAPESVPEEVSPAPGKRAWAAGGGSGSGSLGNDLFPALPGAVAGEKHADPETAGTYAKLAAKDSRKEGPARSRDRTQPAQPAQPVQPLPQEARRREPVHSAPAPNPVPPPKSAQKQQQRQGPRAPPGAQPKGGKTAPVATPAPVKKEAPKMTVGQKSQQQQAAAAAAARNGKRRGK